jgi:hypothetical protein
MRCYITRIQGRLRIRTEEKLENLGVVEESREFLKAAAEDDEKRRPSGL